MKWLLIFLFLPTLAFAQTYYPYSRAPRYDLYQGGVYSEQYQRDVGDYINQQWVDKFNRRLEEEGNERRRYYDSEDYKDPWGYRKRQHAQEEE